MQIEIDFEVFKEVTSRRNSEADSENDVLRREFGLPPSNGHQARINSSAEGDWVTKGVRFPAGTEFRASYKGHAHRGVVKAGALFLERDGQTMPFDSPSRAAMAITQNNVNGWTFWECRFPGQSRWQSIDGLR
jgi:hypothetical protein